MRYAAQQCRLVLAAQTVPIERRDRLIRDEANVLLPPVAVTNDLYAGRRHAFASEPCDVVDPLGAGGGGVEIEQPAVRRRPQGGERRGEQCRPEARRCHQRLARRDDGSQPARERTANFRAVRIGSGADVDVALDDGMPLPERQRTRDDLGGEQPSHGQIGLNARDLGEQRDLAVRLMGLDDHPTAVGKHDPGDAADARLVKEPARDARPEMATAECVDRRGDDPGIVALEDRQLDECRRGVPFAQMRCDDRTEMRDAVVHGITMNRNDDVAQQATTRRATGADPPARLRSVEIGRNLAITSRGRASWDDGLQQGPHGCERAHRMEARYVHRPDTSATSRQQRHV
jgi:hypothetical protein